LCAVELLLAHKKSGLERATWAISRGRQPERLVNFRKTALIQVHHPSKT
jgi:hypothetical protein